MAVTTKTLKLALDTKQIECQLDRAELVDEPDEDEITTFCGDTSNPHYKLTIGGFQDWGTVDGVCALLHTAYKADPIAEVDFVLQVGDQIRTGVCKPMEDVVFGGQAGEWFKFEKTLDVVGIPTESTAPAAHGQASN